MMRSLAVAPALVALVLVVAQPPAPATTELTAGPADPTRSSLEPDRDLRMWRGKQPNMCLVRECERAEPTFCLVSRLSTPEHMRPQFGAKELCDQQPGFRDALQSPTMRAGARPSLRDSPQG